MKRQRGFAGPFTFPTWLIYAVVIAAALGALWYAYTTVDGRGYDRGKAETVASYQARDNKALQEALTKVAALEAEARAQAAAHEIELDKIRRKNRKETEDAKRQHDTDLAAVRAGTLQLRDPGSTGRTQCDHSPAGTPGATAGRGDGASAGGLSDEAAGFLLQLVHDADRNTRQLADAQAVIEAQRRTCNGP